MTDLLVMAKKNGRMCSERLELQRDKYRDKKRESVVGGSVRQRERKK